MWTEITFALGKNGDYIPSSLGGRLISVGTGQAGSETKFLRLDNFNSVNSKA